MTYTCFDVSIEDKIAHIRLSRPEAYNSMTREFWSELPEIVGALDAGSEARAIVLSSTGKHFTAGMDLSVFSGTGLGGGGGGEVGRQRANLRRQVLQLQETFSCLDRARIPVLAAIHGACIGGGVDMISSCDMRYCTEDAYFCIQEINIGMTADVGTFPRLPKLIPEGLVRELAYTGRKLSAVEAKECGLVNRIYPDHGSLVAGVTGIAREISQRSPLAVWGSKEMINYARDHSIGDALDYIATWQTGMFQPNDMLEAFKAKEEQRDPQYDDLLPLKHKL